MKESNSSRGIRTIKRQRLRGMIICVLALFGWAPDPGARAQNARALDAPVRPKLAPGDLRALTGYDFTIATVTLVPATGNVPEHCRVSGQILPEVRFEISLPTEWNRRFYMFGNGGYAG